MSDKLFNGFRKSSIRLRRWNYNWHGKYFVTICTLGMTEYFGEVRNGKMSLNNSGKIAKDIWMKTPEHYSYVQLDEFIVMPNHIHGIIILKNFNYDKDFCKDAIYRVCINEEELNRKNGGGICGQNNPMLNHNLSRIIRWYKGRVTFEIRKKCKEFEWQSRFYEKIIRNEKALKLIRNYIKTNPKRYEDK